MPERETQPSSGDGADAPGLWVVGAVIFGLAGIGGPILAILVFWMMRKYI